MYKNYNINQLDLPLNLEIKIQDNDIARHVNNLVESIPEKAFDKYYKETGCPAYHPRMMLKILLCSYSQSVFSGRKIEALLSDSIRMMWLAQGYSPSYRTINRFRSNKDMQELLCQCFIQFRAQLIKEKIINNEAILDIHPDFEEYLEQDIISDSYLSRLQDDFFDTHILPQFDIIKPFNSDLSDIIDTTN